MARARARSESLGDPEDASGGAPKRRPEGPGGGRPERRVPGAAECALAFGLIWVWDYLAHNPFCGQMFRCGCVFAWDWDRGWRDCNVHDPTAPHCPWCACADFLGGRACYLSSRKTFLACACLAWLGAAATGANFAARLRAAVAAWLAYGLAAGLFFFVVLAPDYPYFFAYARPWATS